MKSGKIKCILMVAIFQLFGNIIYSEDLAKKQFEFAKKLEIEGDCGYAIMEYKKTIHFYPESEYAEKASEEIKKIEVNAPFRGYIKFIEAIVYGNYKVAYKYLSKNITDKVTYAKFEETMKKKIETHFGREESKFVIKENNVWKLNFPVETLGIDTPRSLEGATKGSLASLRSAITIYYGGTEGKYPAKLSELSPRYIHMIPAEKITGSNKVVTKLDGRGGWYYNPKDGKIQINLKGKDSNEIYYSNW